ncbi:MAG: VWA domain-containing protein [Kineosporiaceae bacterium]
MGEGDTDEVLLGLARALRAAGLPVTGDRARVFATAAAAVGVGDRQRVYWAGRATLLGEPDQTAVYDRVFELWFSGRPPRPGGARRGPAPAIRTTLGDPPPASGPGPGGDAPADVVRARASGAEVLRHRDLADLTPAERAVVAELLRHLRPRPPRRPARRWSPRSRGDVDARRTLREHLRRAGEPGPLRHRRSRARPRRVVLLVDVSGSMEPYADALLRLAHAWVRAAPGSTEVFTVGTRLTRVTRALRARDPDEALRAAAAEIPDWSGGTRLGEVLGAFLDRWGRRGTARGAVVVVFSDGWERGDPGLLGEQAARLRRLAHRVLWANPHRGRAGYLPVQGGIAAVLPHLDGLVAGHSVASFAALADAVAEA